MRHVAPFLTYSCLMTLLLAALLLLVFPASRRCRPAWLLFALLFYFLDEAVLSSAVMYPALRVGHWNWSGKTISILLSLCWMPLLGLSRDEIGLRLPKGRKAWVTAGVGICALPLLSAAECVLSPPRSYDLEHLAFEGSLPGLDEELAFRGILFALMLRGLSADRLDARAVLLSAAVVTILFWLAHVVFLTHGGIKYDLDKPEVLLAGILFIWLRIRSGSLVVCVAAHNLDNLANVVIGGLI